MPLMSVINQASSQPQHRFQLSHKASCVCGSYCLPPPLSPPLSLWPLLLLCLFATFSGHLASFISILLVFYDNLSRDLPATHSRYCGCGGVRVCAFVQAPPSAKLNGNLKRRHQKVCNAFLHADWPN